MNGWRGLCIEPNPHFAKLLRAQRTCTVAEVTVDRIERHMPFDFGGGEMGGIVDRSFDNRGTNGAHVKTVWTRRLQDVLAEAAAPRKVDYLNLDVEGAETAALPSSFAWNKFTFLTITIERPPPDLSQRLFRHGYLFVKIIGIADVAYIHASHPNASLIAANDTFVQVPAKCRNHWTSFAERQPLKGVHCASIFGCCTFPGYPQSMTRYMHPHHPAF